MTPPSDPPQPADAAPPEALLAEIGWLRDLARRLARDEAIADDLTQGALVVALENPPNGGRPLRPWLATVVRNLARRRKRADARRAAREHAVSRAEAIGPEGALLEQFEEQQRIARLVGELEPELRVLVLRHFWRGESAAEIARSLGAKPGTVRAQLARSLTKLREAHRRELGDERSLGALAVAAVPGLTTKLLTVLGSLVAMKTAAKLAAVTAVVLVALWGVRMVQDGRAEARVPAPVDEVAALELDLDEVATEEVRETPSTRTELVASNPSETPAVEPEPALAPPSVGLRVVDESARPIEGARLLFVRLDGSEHDLPPSDPSDAEGRLQVEVPRKAMFGWAGQDVRLTCLKVEAPGYAASFFREELPEGGLEELGDRVLHPGSFVAGVVLDERGVGARGVTVAVRSVHVKRSVPDGAFSMMPQPDAPGARDAILRTTTGDDGAFEFEGLVVGPNEFWFQKPGNPWHTEGPFESVAGARRTDVVLQLPAIDAERLVQGQVQTPEGRPFTEGFVRHNQGGGWSFWSDDRLPLDEQGRFELVTNPGASVAFAAFADDDAFGPSATTAGVAGGPLVVLRLEPARLLRTIVTDEVTGDPLDDAWLMAQMGGSDGDEPVTLAGSPEAGDTQGRNFDRTDAEGVCELLAPAATFKVRVGRKGFQSQLVGPFDPAALPEEFPVALEREPGIVGVVRTNGAPVAGATIYLQESWPNARQRIQGFSSRFNKVYGLDAKTDADGRFRQSVDPDREYELSLLVEAEGFARAEVPLGALADVLAGEPVEVELTRGGTLEGRVLVPPSRRALGVIVGISRGDGRAMFTRTDDEGRYSFEHLTPGDWQIEDRANEPTTGRVSILQDGEDPFAPNVEVREGRTTRHDLDLRWQESPRITGRLTIDGEAPGGGWEALVEVDEEADEGAGFRPVPLDGEGRFDVPAAPGPVVLLVRQEEGATRWRFRRELKLTGDTQPIEVDLRTGTVTAEGRKPNEAFRERARHEELGELLQWFEADAEGVLEARVAAWPMVALERKREPGEQRGFKWFMIEALELAPGGTHVVTKR